jgi:uncharacterized protein YdaU (DUF1376 family)
MCYDAFYSTAKDGWDQERFEKHVEALVELHANEFIHTMATSKINR